MDVKEEEVDPRPEVKGHTLQSDLRPSNGLPRVFAGQGQTHQLLHHLLGAGRILGLGGATAEALVGAWATFVLVLILILVG